MDALIELRRVCKTYHPGDNRVEALKDVDLTVRTGEFVAIVGSSGSGKSTLMNILGCLDTADEGSYYLDGEDVSTLSDDELSVIRNRKIGFVFQGFNLVQSLNALEIVELPLLYRGIRRAERREMAVSALKRVGLGERMGHLPSQMSGGQQQRVAIARAIAARPPILLADEPTGNLDRRSGRAVLDILLGLNREGKTVVLITHDREVASRAGRVLRVSDGRVTSQSEMRSPVGAEAREGSGTLPPAPP